MDAREARALFKIATQRKFAAIVRENPGRLAQKAAEIGVKRQQLQQYATGTVPGSDILLTAMVKWGWRIRIEDRNASDHDPKWWECGMGAKGKPQKQVPAPMQLPLFRAIDGLASKDMDIKITKREPDRIRLALDIVFRDKVG